MKTNMMGLVPVPVKTQEGAELPFYATDGSSGMDIRANADADIHPNEVVVVPTGLLVAIPENYELQIRPRSGLAIKGITVLNTPGTIDSDYRGEIKIIMINFGKNPFHIQKGDRIAQAVLQYVPRVEWISVDSLDDTERGSGGFGSTGKQ
mgnify:CR=1 FL=1